MDLSDHLSIAADEPEKTMKTYASYIDHTSLSPTVSTHEIKLLCDEALHYSFAGVCVAPYWVPWVKNILEKDSHIKLVTVIGFPLGMNAISIKTEETKWAIDQGVDEIDMVLNLSALKENIEKTGVHEIEKVVQAASPLPVKVILETSRLEHDEKVRGVQWALKGGATFVKTSTGFGPGGATIEDVKLLKQHAYPQMQVKASGGIRSSEDFLGMLKAGATRVGTSSGVKILKELSQDAIH